jgi:hypothetical protein
MRSLPAKSTRQMTATLPSLDSHYRYVARGHDGTFARLIPQSDADDSWFVEVCHLDGDKGPCQRYLPRGVRRLDVDQVLRAFHFVGVGEWVERQHDGANPNFTKCLGWFRNGNRKTVNWNPDTETLEGLFGLGWAASDAGSMTAQEDK